VDKPNDVNACDKLHFTYSNHWKILHAIWRKGSQLNPGTSNTQKIYIYGIKGGRFICEDENPFTITISKTPVLSQPLILRFADLHTSTLVEGNYFTGTRKWNKIFCWRSHLQRSNFICICSS
jgi:hypothetical protein